MPAAPALATAVALIAALSPASARGAAFPAVDRSTAPISIVYPLEGQTDGSLDADFVLGAVIDQAGKLKINGQPVPIYKTGAFLAWIPLQPGTATLHCELTLPGGATFYYDRSVFNSPAPAPLPQKPLAFDPESPWPRQDVELRPGDWLLPRARATPGQKVQWRLGKLGWQPMREANPALGVYEGAYLVGPDDNINPSEIEYKLGSGFSSISARSSGKAALASGAPPVAALKGAIPFVMLKTGPAEGELFPAYGGARFVTAGRVGGDVKLALSGGLSGWTEAKNLDFLPAQAKPPSAVTDVVSVKTTDAETFVHIGLSERVPFSIDEAADLRSLTVRLYYTTAHTRWIIYHAGDPLVDEIAFKQEAEGVVAVTIKLQEGRTLWGYNPAYEGNGLRLELRRPPTIAPRGSPLKDRVVFLDPGHMPSAWGATGGLGTKEMDVNYAIAERVKARLLKEGARPLMSRASPDDEVSLTDRPKLAWDKRAELFVSIHNNFAPSGTNPLKGAHGYSVFYYHPHSYPLAQAVYKSYEKLVPIPGEDPRFGDLLVARMTQMPAVLAESAYLTLPEQEGLLLDAGFRDKLAEAIVGGLRDFLDAERRRQQAPLQRAKASR